MAGKENALLLIARAGEIETLLPAEQRDRLIYGRP